MVHQTPCSIKLDNTPVPIFSVASGHQLDYVYTWRQSGRVVGNNSPVLWVDTPGVYQCTCTSCSSVEGPRSCSSREITIDGTSIVLVF